MNEINNITYIEGLLADYFSDNLSLRGKAFDSIRQLNDNENINKLLTELEKYFTTHNLSNRNLSFDIYIYFKGNSIPFLEKLLSHIDKDIRKVSTELLIALNSKKSVDKILPLITDEDENVRYSAIEAIGKLGSYIQIPYLFEYYQELPEYRHVLLSAIGDIGVENSEEFVFSVLNSTDDLFLKMSAIDAIGKVGQSEKALYFLVEDIQTSDEELMPLYLKAIYNIALRMGLNFEIPDPVRHIVYNSLNQNDEDYLLNALKLINNDIRQEDLEYFNSKFLISNPKIRTQLIQNLCNIESQYIYSLFLDKLSSNIIELYSFEDFTLDLINNFKNYEVNNNFEILTRNLKYLIEFILDNEKLNFILLLESLSDSFEFQTKDILAEIKKLRKKD